MQIENIVDWENHFIEQRVIRQYQEQGAHATYILSGVTTTAESVFSIS